MKTFLVLVLLGLSLPLFPAPPTLKRAHTYQLKEWDFDPMLVPTVTEDIFSSSVYVTEITITNTTGGAITLTMADKQGTPRNLIGPVSIAAASIMVIRFESRYCPGGLTWLASGSGLVGYVRGRQ